MNGSRWVPALLLVLISGWPAEALPDDNTAPQTRLGAVDVFELAGRSAVAGRFAEALSFYDALMHDSDLEIRSEARFRKGQLLVSLGRLTEAATTYRRLLDEKPAAARVRLELATVLARIGDEPGARRQLRLAEAAGGLPPEVAEQVSRISRALRSTRPIGGSFEVALAPDTNINRATQSHVLETVIAPLLLDADARAKSGVGVRLRGSVFAKRPVTDRLSLVARSIGSADLYRQSSANDLLASVLVGVEWRGERDQANVTYGFGKRWYGGQPFAETVSATGEWQHQLNRKTQFSSNISRTVIRYRRNPLQDGILYDASFTGERALSAQSGFAVGADLARQYARDPSYSSLSMGPLAYAWLDLGRTTLFAAATGKRLIGDQRNFLFTDKRREWFASGRVGATFRQLSFRGFSPTARIGYERNHSTVSIFDYNRTYGEFGLAKSF